MKIIILLILLGFNNGMLWAGELDRLLVQAAENNPALKAKFNEYKSALQLEPQLTSLPDPNVAVGYFISPVETRFGPQSFNVSVSQTFPWFGKLEYQGKAVGKLAESKYEEFISLRDRLYYDVKVTWYELYELDETIRITKDNIELINSFRSIAMVKSETGSSTLTDVIRVDLELEELKNRLEFYLDSRLPLISGMRELVNDPNLVINPIIEIDKLELDQNKEELLNSVISSNPVLKKFGHQSESLEYKLISVEKSGYPNITVGLNYIAINPRSDLSMTDNGKDAFAPMIGFSIPIYRSKYDAMEEETRLHTIAIKDQIIDYKNKLAADIEDKYRNYRDAMRRIDLYISQIDLANRALNILLISYSTASKDFVEVLRMERKVLNYQIELVNAKKDLNIAIAAIRLLIGNN